MLALHRDDDVSFECYQLPIPPDITLRDFVRSPFRVVARDSIFVLVLIELECPSAVSVPVTLVRKISEDAPLLISSQPIYILKLLDWLVSSPTLNVKPLFIVTARDEAIEANVHFMVSKGTPNVLPIPSCVARI